MKLSKAEYFIDNCIVKDTLFFSFKDLLICPLCNKIFKNPFMCINCQKSYCKECLDNYSNSNICPNEKIETIFNHCKSKEEMLSKIKYKCRNCKKEITQYNILEHLKENCEYNEIERNKTLAEEIKTKKQLIKLSKKEMKNKQITNYFTSKFLFLI